MQKGSLVGKGMTAEVYEWQNDKVLKLFYDWFPNEHINYEADIGKAVYNAGIPAPAIYEIIEESARKGILYERINGKSMLKLIQMQPFKIIYYARLLARIQAEIHSKTTDNLPKQKEQFDSAIKNSKEILGDKAELIIDYINYLPDGKSVCHGDFHPDNIIVSDDKSVVIDWINAYVGSPLSDVARTCLMLNSPFIPPGSSQMLVLLSKIAKKLIYKAYVKEYLNISKVRFMDIDAWILPIAAARLRDNLPGEKDWLLNIINARIKVLKGEH